MIDFFIRRPIFATVIALLMVIAGGLSMTILPVAQFPPITPPTVQVTAFYPGASASTTSDVVTRLLERQINGVPGMIYMSSNSVDGGNVVVTVTFDVGAKPLPILVMELVEGSTLEWVVSTKTFDMRRCLQVMDDVLAGLEAMH